MKLGKGVEWAAHTCALLGLLPPGHALPGDALADFLGVPPTYLAKQLQALSRAGIVMARRGVAGGYRLARAPGEINLWDITAALEGTAPGFRCTEVRRSGPCGASPSECTRPCPIAAAFRRAERHFRDALSEVALTEIIADVAHEAKAQRKKRIVEWIENNAAPTT